MSTLEMILSGFYSIFSSFVGAFSGGGSTPLLQSFLLLTTPFSFLTLIALSKIGASSMVLASGNIHRKRAFISKPMFIVAMLSSGLGIAFGTYLAQYTFDESFLKILLACTLLFLAIYELFFSKAPLLPDRVTTFSKKEFIISGFVFFALNIVNAITGGMGLVFVALYTNYLKMSYLQASAYSILVGIPILGLQALYLFYLTQPPLFLVFCIVLGSIVGGHLGTKFQYLKGDAWIKRVSMSTLAVMAVLMLL